MSLPCLLFCCAIRLLRMCVRVYLFHATKARSHGPWLTYFGYEEFLDLRIRFLFSLIIYHLVSCARRLIVFTHTLGVQHFRYIPVEDCIYALLEVQFYLNFSLKPAVANMASAHSNNQVPEVPEEGGEEAARLDAAFLEDVAQLHGDLRYYSRVWRGYSSNLLPASGNPSSSSRHSLFSLHTEAQVYQFPPLPNLNASILPTPLRRMNSRQRSLSAPTPSRSINFPPRDPNASILPTTPHRVARPLQNPHAPIPSTPSRPINLTQREPITLSPSLPTNLPPSYTSGPIPPIPSRSTHPPPRSYNAPIPPSTPLSTNRPLQNPNAPIPRTGSRPMIHQPQILHNHGPYQHLQPQQAERVAAPPGPSLASQQLVASSQRLMALLHTPQMPGQSIPNPVQHGTRPQQQGPQAPQSRLPIQRSTRPQQQGLQVRHHPNVPVQHSAEPDHQRPQAPQSNLPVPIPRHPTLPSARYPVTPRPSTGNVNVRPHIPTTPQNRNSPRSTLHLRHEQPRPQPPLLPPQMWGDGPTPSGATPILMTEQQWAYETELNRLVAPERQLRNGWRAGERPFRDKGDSDSDNDSVAAQIGNQVRGANPGI